jgi:hypothetical protein
MRIPSLALSLIIAAATPAFAQQDGNPASSQPRETGSMERQSFIGMWVTKDGHIRHELLPNGRYDEARGTRKSAYRGRYTITGNHIDYVDDTGFTADGEFIDGVLHHGGMLFYREQ